MSKALKLEFEFVRSRLFKSIEATEPEILDIQPKGFNNTIHWHIGHILTISENFLFEGKTQIPENYKEFFGGGTKPSDWSSKEVPSVETLLNQLKEQLKRIEEIPTERFEEVLPEPKFGASTFGELVSFTAYHESFHYGQIHTMKRLIATSVVESK
ncbi:DinB family protein [Niallia sp. Krafla_26]|uniref:DinB family protein n=1 Tax=Niallia sp. Krafla_26 TaxID=3064703 RepID=UPI003D171515